MGKKKKIMAGKAQATIARKGPRLTHEERRAHKLERRKKEKKSYTTADWAAPAPSHLVAKLDMPNVKSKYQSYFEFTDNPEKKEKKLEFRVVNDAKPPPGFVFVPIGDPILTNKCKELSREAEAMILIVSTWKEENSKISEHVHRTGYHFRETIVEEAREIIGETVISKPITAPGFIEPIPESQDEINKQADGAIRDLFPRIPNTDRTMIIEHAFKKGALFHGEPTVGLQSNIPLSRRVQLAVLAHIRHTHTRYDNLLRETSWMNARKAVEPVCLDVLVRWRGDEETGRDQIDEILREVVIITDSEGESDSSDDDEDTSDEEDEVTSASSPEGPSLQISRKQQVPMACNVRPVQINGPGSSQGPQRENNDVISSRTRSKVDPNKKAQRGFKRYQAAWEDAMHRRQERPASGPNLASTAYKEPTFRRPQNAVVSPTHATSQYPSHQHVATRPMNPAHHHMRKDHADPLQPAIVTRPQYYYSQQGPVQGSSFAREEVNVRSHTDRLVHFQELPPRYGTPSYIPREQRASQVVRGSPPKRGPEDMPLPSIETTSSNATTRIDELHSAHQNFVRSQDFPRRVNGSRLQTSAPGEVIVINDDTPPVKRRRVVNQDDFGSFRPVPSRDRGPYVSAPHSASYLSPASSAQPEHSCLRRSAASSYPAQALARKGPELYTDPVTAERLPIYDAPASVYLTQRSEYARRTELEPVVVRRVETRIEQPRYTQTSRDNISTSTENPARLRNRVEGIQEMESIQLRQVKPYNYDGGAVKLLPQEHPDFQEPRSQYRIPASNGPGWDSIHSFSHSRLDGPSSQARNCLTIHSDKSQQTALDLGDTHRYEEYSRRPNMPETVPRARSPRYVERSMHQEDFMRQPTHGPVPPQAHSVPVYEHARIAREPYPPPTGDARYLPPADQRDPIYILD